MAKLKILESLTGTAAEKAAARAAKLSAQLADVDRELEAAETRRAQERKALTEALSEGLDTTRTEASIVELCRTVERLGERRAALAALAEKATADAAEVRRAATLDSARAALDAARSEAENARERAVAALLEAQKAAGRFVEAARLCSSAAAGLRLLDDEAADPTPETATLFWSAERAATEAGLRPLGSMPATFTFYA